VPVDVDAPAEAVWETVTDWAGQSEWMLGTRVAVDGGGPGHFVGARLRAVTGIGPLGFTDTMEIVEWEPPRRCVVRHLGKVVRGDGVFEVVPLGPHRARFLWSELLDLPLGVVGAWGWRVVEPAFRVGLARSLRAMARRCEAAHRG
jgi:Polyketide cyclase / dehydrase and lipid transport